MNKAAEIIRTRRLKLGLSQKKLAEKAGLCINTIYNVEANKGKPDLATYQKICDALGIKLSSIL
ncbi:MAG: helix-turn-helix domain-containing protein [Ruminococcus sp.]|jgi:transcriptional regulator with XRE-family HTH domain|nr:helix-turn-helix domain-containing protein [Ruminococcus sp.]